MLFLKPFRRFLGVVRGRSRWFRHLHSISAGGANFQDVERNSCGLNDVGRKGFKLFRQIINTSKEMGLIKKDVDEVVLAELLYSLFLGFTQFEENKRQISSKDYVSQSLERAFSLIADGCCPLGPETPKVRAMQRIRSSKA
jgi:hypothetical protein